MARRGGAGCAGACRIPFVIANTLSWRCADIKLIFVRSAMATELNAREAFGSLPDWYQHLDREGAGGTGLAETGTRTRFLVAVGVW